MSSPGEPPSRTIVRYHPAFVAELQTMHPKTARELVHEIKTAFQAADWEKSALKPVNDKRMFYLPKVGGFTLIGGKMGKNEVLLLSARRS